MSKYVRIPLDSALGDYEPWAKVYWVSADSQREIPMGGISPAEARLELLDQCAGNESDEAEILAGSLYAI